jgi:hypothetical protein
MSTQKTVEILPWIHSTFKYLFEENKQDYLDSTGLLFDDLLHVGEDKVMTIDIAHEIGPQ